MKKLFIIILCLIVCLGCSKPSDNPVITVTYKRHYFSEFGDRLNVVFDYNNPNSSVYYTNVSWTLLFGDDYEIDLNTSKYLLSGSGTFTHRLGYRSDDHGGVQSITITGVSSTAD